MVFGLRVDLLPLEPNEAGGRQRVRVAQVALRRHGKGPSNVSRTEAPAKLTFHAAGFVSIRDGSAPRTARVGSLSGTLSFDPQRNKLSFLLADDVELELEQPLERAEAGADPQTIVKARRAFQLEFDKAVFPVAPEERLLLLPDEVLEETRYLELRVELEVNGATEASTDVNGVLDTPITEDAPIPIVPNVFRIIIRDHLGKPQPGVDYELEVDGEVQSGTTDGDGATLLHTTRSDVGKLRVAGNEYEVSFVDEVGADVAELQGILNALGFRAGDTTGSVNRQTEDAIFAFQRREGMEESGEFDEATAQRLRELHDGGALEESGASDA